MYLDLIQLYSFQKQDVDDIQALNINVNSDTSDLEEDDHKLIEEMLVSHEEEIIIMVVDFNWKKMMNENEF